MSDWSQKVVLITGGSRGLGLELAKVWAAQQAKVIIVARDAQQLETSAAEIRSQIAAAQVLTMVADLTKPDKVTALFHRVESETGRLDVLVNCAGISARGRILETPPEEFTRLLELNLLATVRCVQAASKLLLASRGSIVNIGSLAGRSASRYLGAYPASKFALTAYTQQLRLELAEEGVHLLLVSPGPIRRADGGSRYQHSGSSELPPDAMKPGGGVKLKGIDPTYLAEKIVKSCQRRQPDLVVPGRARILFAIQQLFPRFGDWILSKMT